MSNLRFYNTLGRKYESFVPLEKGRVKLYTCGPTVYNYSHIGNLRTFLFEDLLRRALKYLGYEVLQVMNLTDVDDKTIRDAAAQNLSLDELTERYIDAFMEDLETLQIEKVEHYPRATRHIKPMITMIEALMEKGYAYSQDDSVFFRISKDEDYGKLSRVDLTQNRQGTRVASDEYGKEDVRDFVLWKGAKEGEPSWDSPWGPGRPGWHIECSAMSIEYLGPTFDIHCGGVDNLFPHHENEIAQSECATGQDFVRYWLHSEHLIVEGEKMSKSLGNFYTLRDLVDQGSSPRAIRFLLLGAHYRQKLNFTHQALEASEGALRRIDEMRFRLEDTDESGSNRPWVNEACQQLRNSFRIAMEDDLNVSGGLAAVFSFVKAINLRIDEEDLGSGDRHRLLEALAEVDRVFSVFDPNFWKQGGGEDGLTDQEIETLIGDRKTARANREFARADEIRAELANQGIILEDTSKGTRWKRG